MASGQHISYITNIDVLTIEQDLMERDVNVRHGEKREPLETKLKQEISGNLSF